MSKAIMKTAEAPAIARISDLPAIPDAGLIGLSAICRAIGGGDPDALENQCLRLGIPVEPDGPGWGRIRTADVERLVGPIQARTVLRNYRPEMVRFTSLGGLLGVHPGEALRLCELRGVLVDKAPAVPEVSRSGASYLRRILDVERAMVLDDSDWFAGPFVLGQLKAALRTQANGPADVRSDRNQPQVDPDWPLVERCGWAGVRWKRKSPLRWTRGRVHASGFDAFRLTGVAFEGADVPTYLEKMLCAHQSVFPTAGDPSRAG